ncbi:tripartite-type tricarboxylate transporter receptor subunit TctC [Stella humosa]|uniref:Tripartite-type tricarboxylate transporter receptor subunit TctC n=1 Tax=Stella humosa TaxID=94 RepID=A0A3N1M8P6_9PROT|nr:tripartite tricarboxylate transporter substrate binding protein [Stella humosa]ROQ00093.1 tripartite-type tricarboxylate transporter receptor subunit TctC [Stella humosa]BBK30672.1 MFS transporter [Stella humosa]
MKTIPLLAAAALAIAPAIPAAAKFPEKPIRMVVGFTPAGATDILARVVAAKVGEMQKWEIVVDNKPGAAGNVGAEIVAKAPADGHTWLLTQVATHGIVPSLYKKLPFDAVKDFAGITQLVGVPNVLSACKGFPAETVADVIRIAKEKPGTVSFASSGNGTSLHMSGHLFKVLAGVDILHVPYRGAGPALNDCLAGNVSLIVNNFPETVAHVQAGTLKPLAVTTVNRAPQYPNVPTMREAGVAGYDVSAWFGIVVPAKTPRDVVETIHAAVVKALAEPDVRARLLDLGGVVVASKPEEFETFYKGEIARWKPVVETSGAQIE